MRQFREGRLPGGTLDMVDRKRPNAHPDAWPEIDTSMAHAARVYDVYLGGDANFAVDRAAAEHAASVHPGGMDTVRASVRSNRAFLVRAVRWLAGEAGVRQFLDVGSGIPNGQNVHAVAQQTAPESRIVYVDNDPTVLAHAHQVLGSRVQGTVDYVWGDLHAPTAILDHAAATLDFTQPVAVLLIGILHFFADTDDPYQIVAHLMEAAPSGSYLAVCHLAADIHPDEMIEVARRLNETTAESWALRSRNEVAQFLDGLKLVEPGVVQVDEWRPDDEPGPVLPPKGRTNPLWVGVGRKS
ncbi:MAG TPA: SAM-dependent methyltransferase [Acidimicrobiales bacterium]|nr:SAM-dependent methyltransferase [Acidimicrobiales bacterium]